MDPIRSSAPPFDVRDFFDKTPALFCVLDTDNRMHHPNLAWERVTGLSVEALDGSLLDEHLHPDERDPARRTSRISVEAQGAIVQETRFLCADGTYRWIEWTMRVVFERGLVYCCARAIDQPRRATVTSARRLETYLRRAPVAMIESEFGRGITEWSTGAERIFGFSRSEALGKPIVDLLVPAPKREEVLATVYAIRDGKLPAGRFGVTENLTKGGGTVVCEWHNAPLADDEGRVRSILSIAVDRTEIEAERARAEESLARFHLLMRSSKNGLWDHKPTDGSAEIGKDSPIYMSEGLERMIGMPLRTMGDWFPLLHEEDADAVRMAFHAHLAEKRDETYIEYRLVRPDKTILWIACTWQSIWDHDGKLQRIAGAIVDISDRKQAEAELRDKVAVIERQADAIRELSTPILEVQEGVLCLPLIGVVDSKRAAEMMNTALGSIVSMQARFLIIDLTGVPVLDTSTADRLLSIARAAGLVGAKTVITGLKPAVAQTVVTLGVAMGDVKTLRNLKDGLRHCAQEARK